MQNNNNKIESRSFHLTTNTTSTPWSTGVMLLSLVICVTAAGTTWNVTVKNKEGTAKTIYSQATVVAGTTVLSFTDLGGVEMTGGIDILTSNGTPGSMDVFVTAMRLD